MESSLSYILPVVHLLIAAVIDVAGSLTRATVLFHIFVPGSIFSPIAIAVQFLISVFNLTVLGTIRSYFVLDVSYLLAFVLRPTAVVIRSLISIGYSVDAQLGALPMLLKI